MSQKVKKFVSLKARVPGKCQVSFYPLYVIPPKEFLTKKSSQNITSKNSFQKNTPHKNPSKNIPPKNHQKFYDFENIQFPTSHLEAENPFGLASTHFHFERM